jgi:hypothetical protein
MMRRASDDTVRAGGQKRGNNEKSAEEGAAARGDSRESSPAGTGGEGYNLPHIL